MSTTIKRFNFLDQLEIFQANAYQADFPLHLHDKLCITLTTRGTECTQVNNQELISPYQGISLTYANEIHANPNTNNGAYSFLTYYISPDVITHLYNNEHYFFKDRILQDTWYYHQLLNYATSSHPTEEKFISILKNLIGHYFTRSENHTIGNEMAAMDYTEVISYIDTHFSDAISLQELARMRATSKFSFIREFKKIKGITPAQYITLRRIEAVKKKLRQGNSIVDAALCSGFYDQSHMSRNFKKITGITPRHYQKGCNIIQEF